MRSIIGKKTLTLLLFLCILGFTSQISAHSLRMLQEKSFDVSEGELLEIQTDVGDVDIKTWSSDKVHIKVFGNSKAEDKMDFVIKKTSGGVLIDGQKEGSWFWSWGGIDVKYEIKVPAKFNAEISTSGGDINLVDLMGEIKLKTSGGDIYAENVEGNLIAVTSGGDVELYGGYGDIEASTSGGDIIVKGSEGKVNASTSGGDIEIDYRGANKGINASTSGGDIDLTIPADFKADVYLKTSGGDVDCNFEARVEEVSSSKFIGKLDGGGPELVCKTSGGDITVREAD